MSVTCMFSFSHGVINGLPSYRCYNKISLFCGKWANYKAIKNITVKNGSFTASCTCAFNLFRNVNQNVMKYLSCFCHLSEMSTYHLFVAFVEDNATMTSIRFFENHLSYFVQNRRKKTLLNSFLYDKQVVRWHLNRPI